MRKITALILIGISLLCASPANASDLATEDQSAAVILAYSRIGDDHDTENALQTSLFEEHIHYLVSEGYNVIKLEHMLEAQRLGKPLPPKSIVITFEGGYKSALKNAIPLLQKLQFPFTVFYAVDDADDNGGDYLSWLDLKALQSDPRVSFGILPSTETILAGKTELEILTLLNKAKTRHRDNLHEEPIFFSYPFGIYDATLMEIIKKQGYKAALSINSGVASHSKNQYTLPRFSITDEYGNMDRFRNIVKAKPMPITEYEPQTPIVTTPTPLIGFNLHPEINAKDLQCFASGQPSPTLEILGEHRIELRLKQPLSNERTRVSCISPIKSEPDQEIPDSYRWLGFLLLYTP